tara:strand:- start:251 stop:436 length:186 start_codon:yes stop_codon:yes gene_type:complete
MARMNGKAKNGLKKGIRKAKAGAKKPAAKNGKFADTAFGQKILARQAAAKGKKPANGKKKK